MSAHRPVPRVVHRRAGGGGYVFGLTLHVVLLLLVLGEVVFLASRYRFRVDLTADKYYTLTESTRRVLGKLEDRLLVEAYFSPDSELPTAFREYRQMLRNILDEYVQSSNGRMVVQYFDPQSDSDLREKALRIGIEPKRTQDVQQTTFSDKEIWQGMRLRYAGRKQKLVKFQSFADRPAAYEAMLTPIVKALTVDEKPKIGLISYPGLPPQLRGFIHVSQQEGPKEFKKIPDLEQIRDRYKFVDLEFAEGQPVPDDVRTLLLIRPKDLTDRQKYSIDQFLMRGGKLVVFADTADVSLGQMRLMTTREVTYDDAGSELKFLEQLAHYGVELGEKVLLDAWPAALDPFAIPRVTPQGVVGQQLVPYPYWFKPLDLDWATKAEDFAKDQEGVVDEQKAAAYHELFEPGIDSERAKGLAVPSFYWPCRVDLAERLPDGVEGEVLMRTSPLAAEHSPPRDLNPVGTGENMQATWIQFQTTVNQLLQSEARRQFGLMVSLRGTFPSFFTGKKIPGRDSDAPPEPIRVDEPDPLLEPVGKDPVAPEPAEPIGPEPEQQAKGGDAAKETDGAAAEPVFRAPDSARLVVIGDSDFIRDDLVGGEYARIGGPVSRLGPTFFLNLLDWLAGDQDLFELINKQVTDRTQQFISDDLARNATNPQKVEESKSRKERLVRLGNVAIPPAALLALGLIVFAQRRARKNAFLRRSGI